MNILLWVLQGLLALMNLAGGSYKLFNYDELAKVPAAAALPRAGWAALGVLEIVCAVLLIAPVAVKDAAALTPLVATVLAVEELVLAVVDSRYSTALTAQNPMWWAAAMAVLSAILAYGRYAT